ncbi:hypothetical protein CHU98_g11021 [Xylaria longipes]|nr:hypothetical protein CHU98_g11021 [Xylaria longipes]
MDPATPHSGSINAIAWKFTEMLNDVRLKRVKWSWQMQPQIEAHANECWDAIQATKSSTNTSQACKRPDGMRMRTSFFGPLWHPNANEARRLESASSVPRHSNSQTARQVTSWMQSIFTLCVERSCPKVMVPTPFLGLRSLYVPAPRLVSVEPAWNELTLQHFNEVHGEDLAGVEEVVKKHGRTQLEDLERNKTRDGTARKLKGVHRVVMAIVDDDAPGLVSGEYENEVVESLGPIRPPADARDDGLVTFLSDFLFRH